MPGVSLSSESSARKADVDTGADAPHPRLSTNTDIDIDIDKETQELGQSLPEIHASPSTYIDIDKETQEVRQTMREIRDLARRMSLPALPEREAARKKWRESGIPSPVKGVRVSPGKVLREDAPMIVVTEASPGTGIGGAGLELRTSEKEGKGANEVRLSSFLRGEVTFEGFVRNAMGSVSDASASRNRDISFDKNEIKGDATLDSTPPGSRSGHSLRNSLASSRGTPPSALLAMQEDMARMSVSYRKTLALDESSPPPPFSKSTSVSWSQPNFQASLSESLPASSNTPQRSAVVDNGVAKKTLSPILECSPEKERDSPLRNKDVEGDLRPYVLTSGTGKKNGENRRPGSQYRGERFGRSKQTLPGRESYGNTSPTPRTTKRDSTATARSTRFSKSDAASPNTLSPTSSNTEDSPRRPFFPGTPPPFSNALPGSPARTPSRAYFQAETPPPVGFADGQYINNFIHNLHAEDKDVNPPPTSTTPPGSPPKHLSCSSPRTQHRKNTTDTSSPRTPHTPKTPDPRFRRRRPLSPAALNTPKKEFASKLDRALDEHLLQYAREGKAETPAGQSVRMLCERRFGALWWMKEGAGQRMSLGDVGSHGTDENGDEE
jgi:hypothetical protein